MANIAEMVRELQQERDRLNKAIAALSPLAGTNRTLSARGGSSGPRRTLSAAARKKVSLAQKARWRKWGGEISRKGKPARVTPGNEPMWAAPGGRFVRRHRPGGAS